MDGEIRTDDDDLKIKGAATKPTDSCTICLEPISERAVAAVCNHLSFDFICLVSWLQEQSTCPLCKADIQKVQYDWRSPDDYKTYHVPKKDLNKKATNARRLPFRRHLPPRSRRFQEIAPPIDDTLEQRRRVYREGLFALRVGANSISQYRDFALTDFATSSDLQSRARIFLRRELRVFTFLDEISRTRNRDFLIEYIVAVLRSNELKGADGRAEELVGEFVGQEYAARLLHELGEWLRSPFARLEEWDERLQYRTLVAQGDNKRQPG